MTDRAALVEAARDSIARGSKSFRFASKLFDRRTREKAWLLYAWCRACDDLADGQEMGHGMHAVKDAPARLELIRDRTARAIAGQDTGDDAFDGFGVVARECGISEALAQDLIAGFALDSIGWRPHSEDDLYRYCYHVAGVVGLMMALVMGVSPDDRPTLGFACDLGMAFQLANIARDIAEDAGAGRCYLPTDWLAEYDVPADELADPRHRAALAAMARRLADAAAMFEGAAKAGTPALGNRSAWAVLSAAGIYGGIAREVAKRGAKAWDARVVTSRRSKLGSVLWAAGQAATRWRYARRGEATLWRPASLA